MFLKESERKQQMSHREGSAENCSCISVTGEKKKNVFKTETADTAFG